MNYEISNYLRFFSNLIREIIVFIKTSLTTLFNIINDFFGNIELIYLLYTPIRLKFIEVFISLF